MTVQTSGGKIISTAINYIMSRGDAVVLATASDIAITLPSAAGAGTIQCEVKNKSTGSITINTFGGQTIDGQLSLKIYPDENLTVVSDNANWVIV